MFIKNKIMRSLITVINIAVLITLWIFAKDSLIAEFNHSFPPTSSVGPTTTPITGTIEVAFSPNNGVTKRIIKAIADARKSILVSAYSFTSKDIAEALLEAKKRQVTVKLILDKSQVSQRYSSVTFFVNLGFDLRIDIKHAIFHNKVMVIDDKTIITGSFNFTKAAETKNAENVLIIRDNPALAQLYSKNWWFHWHQSVSREEFLRRKS